MILYAPFLLYSAYHQFGASGRLLDFGLPRPTGAFHVVGAQGGRSPRHIWRYAIPKIDNQTVANYGIEAARANWIASKDKGKPLRLQRNDVAFLVFTEDHGSEMHFIIQRLK